MFAHNDFAKDVELHPEWADSVPTFTDNIFEVKDATDSRFSVKSSRTGGCPFGF